MFVPLAAEILKETMKHASTIDEDNVAAYGESSIDGDSVVDDDYDAVDEDSDEDDSEDDSMEDDNMGDDSTGDDSMEDDRGTKDKSVKTGEGKNEIVRIAPDFTKNKHAIQKFSKELPKNTELPTVPTEGSIWFLNGHNVTGE